MTAHPASAVAHDGREHVGSEQWRVLRFNTVTRQSVNRVRLRHNARGHEATEARPDCLAFPYLKTMAASGTPSIASSYPHLPAVPSVVFPGSHQSHQCHAVSSCVGRWCLSTALIDPAASQGRHSSGSQT